MTEVEFLPRWYRRRRLVRLRVVIIGGIAVVAVLVVCVALALG
jgi:hypothetical protein